MQFADSRLPEIATDREIADRRRFDAAGAERRGRLFFSYDLVIMQLDYMHMHTTRT